MTDKTSIEWTDATWNPVRGCSRVSEGCRNCYAEIMAGRFSEPGQWGHGLAKRVTLPDGSQDHRWTGKIEVAEHLINLPLKWRNPRRIFVNSTSDIFHEGVPDSVIDQVFAVMALAPQHTYQVLTKRSKRMREYLNDMRVPARIKMHHWPLPNVWLGVSVEDQTAADERIHDLLTTPAAVRFVSAEPLLGRVSLRNVFDRDLEAAINAIDGRFYTSPRDDVGSEINRLDWVIVGGESGPGARPFDLDHARNLRDQFKAGGVAFFMKQTGGTRKSAMPPIPDDMMIREYPDTTP